MFNQKLFSMKKILLFLLITCLIPAWGYSQYSTTSVEESKAATLQAAQDMQTMDAQDALKMEEVARLKAASSGVWTSRVNDAYYANLDDGIKPDFILEESQMIDRDYIVSKINTYKKN